MGRCISGCNGIMALCACKRATSTTHMCDRVLTNLSTFSCTIRQSNVSIRAQRERRHATRVPVVNSVLLYNSSTKKAQLRVLRSLISHALRTISDRGITNHESRRSVTKITPLLRHVCRSVLCRRLFMAFLTSLITKRCVYCSCWKINNWYLWLAFYCWSTARSYAPGFSSIQCAGA